MSKEDKQAIIDLLHKRFDELDERFDKLDKRLKGVADDLSYTVAYMKGYRETNSVLIPMASIFGALAVSILTAIISHILG